MSEPKDDAGVTGPLQGVRVLALTRILAGPTAAQLLGDYGADVVKIERPGSGDDTRQWGPPWLGIESALLTPVHQCIFASMRYPNGFGSGCRNGCSQFVPVGMV